MANSGPGKLLTKLLGLTTLLFFIGTLLVELASMPPWLRVPRIILATIGTIATACLGGMYFGTRLLFAILSGVSVPQLGPNPHGPLRGERRVPSSAPSPLTPRDSIEVCRLVGLHLPDGGIPRMCMRCNRRLASVRCELHQSALCDACISPHMAEVA